MGDLLGFVGTIVGAKISADAQKDIANRQARALDEQRQFVFDELAPEIVGPAATKADIANAKQRLQLQFELDPALFATRYATEESIKNQVGRLGPNSLASQVGLLAAGEAAQPSTAGQGKQQLIDAALKELSLGATLPPDVQAELVKAGLEKGGMVTGAASPKGIGGQLTRQLIGTAGIQLQQQRQANAANLLGQAQNLESARAGILQNLFPNLSTVQLNQLQGTQSALQQSNNMLPSGGLTGTDVANLWLARVGATTQLGQQAANAQAAGQYGAAAAWQQGIGAATPYAANAANSYLNRPVQPKSDPYGWNTGVNYGGSASDFSGESF